MASGTEQHPPLDRSLERARVAAVAHADRGQDGPRTAPIAVWAQNQCASCKPRKELPDGEDIVARVYGSEDFKEGCAASPRSAHPGGAEK